MPIACLVVAFGVAAPNPLSFDGWAVERYDADRPGIAGVSRHPLLLGLTLWAAGHVVPNGDLAHAIMFGAFALFSLAGMLAIDARRQRTMGRRTWDTLAARTSFLPCSALLDGRWRPAVRQIDPLRLGIAVLAWGTLLSLHDSVIGRSPLPFLQGLQHRLVVMRPVPVSRTGGPTFADGLSLSGREAREQHVVLDVDVIHQIIG
jgi:uncharacterized membrane protein